MTLPHAPTLRWVESDVDACGVRLHVRRARLAGDVAVGPILLLHGLGVSGVVWQAFSRRLAPPTGRYAAITPDLRGHGASDAPPLGYEPADYARDLACLLEAPGSTRQATPMPVLGHSLGALVALDLAAARPDLVSHAILVDPPLDGDLPNPDVLRVYALRHGPPGALEEYLAGTNPGGGDLLARLLAGVFRQAADGPFKAILGATTGHPAAWAGAPGVRQPCLVVQGDPGRGGLLGDSAAEAFVARLPRGRRLKLAGATHAVHASHPADLATAVLQFLADETG